MPKSKRQTGKSKKSIDRKYKAKHPGPRTSASGRKYSERRRNRSDINRRTRL